MRETIPKDIKADKKKLALWKTATKEERFVATKLCETRGMIETFRVEKYLTFAEEVVKRYPRVGNRFQRNSRTSKKLS